ncbi:MAG: putative oxidoreductase SadH [Acidobacteria bacterium ADurb.Bin340]|nr:MAG: putative oxidoreductase SadH [Acidobacteria bacterium ADurb.Bin340]HQL47205.1 SDR family NAD(P)-dependent oxidoreductase [Holophaga sp.]
MDRGWILVTGCSSGIGRALVAELRGRGWCVVATARNREVLADLPSGPDLRLLSLDVTDSASLAAAAATCADLRLVGLVNNAGYGQMGPLELLRPEELRAQFETNVIGLQACTNAFLPLLRAGARPGEGRIVQVASVLGRLSIPMAGAYNASKHAVVALAETLRLEVGREIAVILVEPGAIKTAFRATLKRAWGDLPRRAEGTRYQAAIDHYAKKRDDFAAQHGLTAEACARRIAAAMDRKRPPRRLIVGTDSFWAQVAHRLLPAALFERLVRRSYGL